MKINRLSIALVTFLLILLVAGCSNQEITEKADFMGKLTENSWSLDISTLNLSGEITFNQEDAGVVSLSTGQSKEFEYTVSNISEDGNSAEIQVFGTNIMDIDGKTVKATFVSDGLKLTYSGFAFVLKPVE